jgi:REP element-mobilizing transposase RayT
LAARQHDHRIRLAAKTALRRPAAILNGVQARAIGRGFEKECRHNGITVWGLAILPEHCHLVIARHHQRIERLVNVLKGGATRQLVQERIHPFMDCMDGDGKLPTVWSRGFWKVYLNDPTHIATAIRYVECNPLKEGKKLQRWGFVREFRMDDVRWRAPSGRG